jgi:hypothetical protein
MQNDDMIPIYSRLDRLEAKLDQIVEALTQQVTICGPSRAKLESLCNTVYGNGRDGLITRIDRVETVRRVAWHVAAVTLGLVSAIAGSLITWLLGRT